MGHTTKYPLSEGEGGVLILDMGGVLMQHNMPECLNRFRHLLGEEQMNNLLGLATNGEGAADSLMEQFERGLISADDFIDTLLRYARPGTTPQDLIDAWNAMHGGIPADRLALLHQWHDRGYRLFLLSNNNELHWHDICSRYDMSVFEHCFLSHLLHLSKPDPRIYAAVQSYLTLHRYPTPYCFVDDLPANLLPAKALGWHTYPTLTALSKDM